MGTVVYVVTIGGAVSGVYTSPERAMHCADEWVETTPGMWIAPYVPTVPPSDREYPGMLWKIQRAELVS